MEAHGTTGPLARRRRVVASLVVVLMGACTGGTTSLPTRSPEAGPSPGGSAALSPLQATPLPKGSFALVGHTGLFARGMNAGLAVWGDHAYVGSRTDGSEGHEHPGVLIVSIRDPAHPRVVGEIGPPDEGNSGETSRELRIWPEQGLLIVLNFACDQVGHRCARALVSPSFRFYDVRGSLAERPRLVATYEPTASPHEFFLWQDPANVNRALIFMSTPGGLGPTILVTDISGARRGEFRELATWRGSFPGGGSDDDIHSLSVSPDGRIAYVAHLANGFLQLDTSELASGVDQPEIRSITPVDRRVTWPDGPGPHSAVPIPGRDLVLTTDEVYGAATGGGCPWGWVRIIDVSTRAAPSIVSEYRVRPYNDPALCSQIRAERTLHTSFSSHNPTVTEHLAFVAWHSAGLQAFSTEDPAHPVQVAEFVPEPLQSVSVEDPLLSSGPDKIVMWSYPVVQDGLIYVVDVRNGLYVLHYRGPLESEVSSITFLEGNSNLVDGGTAG